MLPTSGILKNLSDLSSFSKNQFTAPQDIKLLFFNLKTGKTLFFSVDILSTPLIYIIIQQEKKHLFSIFVPGKSTEKPNS